jgi:hypothetical protein
MRGVVALVLAGLAVASLSGCAKARYVEVSQQGGIVAIPANTNRWPTYYRDQAMELIRQKCPDGYEVVQEEEFVTGQVARTNSRTKTKQAPSLDLNALQNDARRSEDAGISFTGLSIPLGRTEEVTDETTNYTDVTEYRFHFRPKTP